MKKIVSFILLYPMLLLAAHPEEIAHEAQPRETTAETERLEEKRMASESAYTKRFTNQPIRPPENDDQPRGITTTQETSQPTKKLDLKELARQDSLQRMQRATEDAQRQERWELEDQKEKESRKEQSFFERAFNKMSGIDSTGEEEKNAVRSKNLFETNKTRMFQDFDRQSQRFDDFAQHHTKFQSGDGATLLKLGKMNDFITMDKNSRTQLLDDITTIVNDPAKLQNFSIEAMQDLVQLAHLSRTGDLPPAFDALATHEISNLSKEQAAELKATLIKFLQDSMNESLASMRAFSDAVESETMKDSIKDLASIRRIKNFSNNGTMVLGTVGLAVMVIPGVSHIASAVHLTAERLFIGAKALFLGAHASGGAEGYFERKLQDKYTDAFQHLLPKTTKLLKTEAIKTGPEEKGYLGKAKDWIKNKAKQANDALENSKVGDHYKKAKKALSDLHDKVSNSDFVKNAKNSLNKAADWTRKQFRKIGTEKAKTEIAHEFSLGIDLTPEEKEKITKNEIAKAEIQAKIDAIQEKIDAHTKAKGSAPAFDIDLYKLQDELVTHQRAQEDLLRELDWKKEDAAAKDQRDKQGMSERILKGASTDAGIDKEKESIRNKEIIEINRKRMQEDFKVKADRFVSFAKNNSEFAAKTPWNNLLRLGDMNAFTTMTPEARDQMLTEIETSMADFFTDESQTFDNKYLEAARQLVSLTNLYRPSGNKLPDEISKALQSEITSKNSADVTKALKKFFLLSTTDTLNTLKEFSKNIDANMDSLAKIRTAKKVSFASIMIVGIAGVAVMVTGHPMVFDKVKITLEQCALAGKAALLGAHVSSHEEKDIVRTIQDQYVTTFQAILPESTQLLESVAFKNEAKTIGQRLKETTIGGAIHKYVVEPVGKAAHAVAKGAKNLHEKYTKQYTDKAKTAVKSAVTTIANGAKAIHEHTTKPIIDAVTKTANTAYESSGAKDLYNKTIGKRKTAQRQKLQSQFNLAPTEAANPDATQTTSATTATTTQAS